MNANVRTDMLRQGTIPANPSLLAHNTTFMQNPSQSGQQPLSQGHMGLPPTAANANQAIAINAQNATRFLSMQQANGLPPSQPQQQQSRMMARQGAPSGQHIISSGAPHLSAIGANQLFPPGGMQSAAPNLGARRGPPQPQPSGAHIAGLPPNSMTLAMNPQNPIQNHHLRPVQQQPVQRMQPPMSGVPSEMAMAMARQGNHSNGLPQNMTRTGPTIGALNQPPQAGQVAFSPGMQTPHPQNSLQNPAQIPNQLPISSPRPGSHPQANVTMTTPGPSQAPINRTQMTPDNTMFGMGFPPFSQGPSSSRIPNNGQFPFASSNSPVQISDMPTNMSGSIINTTGGTPTRATFQLTPAQQLEQMGGSQDSFNGPFSVQPPRPPSQHNLHSSLSQQHPAFQPPLHRQSPHPSDSLVPHPQRPASQPQPQQLMPGRPPSQPSHAPSQASINVNTNTSTRISAAPSGAQPHLSMGTPPVNIAPRPAQQPIAPPSGPAGSVPPLPPSDAPSGAMSVLPSQANSIPQVGYGQGLQRLLQFSGLLANDSPKKLQLSWWEECIREYFTPSAIMKITLWKDNQRTEAKPFEIGVPILPRFFLVTTQSGVNSMTLALDGARERTYRNPHHCIIECPSAVWTYKYNSGYTVILRGPLTAHIAVSQLALSAPDPSVLQGGQRHLKFENLQFDADHHDKYILLDTVMHSRISESPIARNDTIPTINSMAMLQHDDERKWEEPRIMIERSLIPGEPVNAFGIPQATMRCLELAESVGQMSDLIAYSTENKLGPLEALKKFAAHIRESQNYGPFNSILSTGNTTSNSPNAFTIVTGNPNGPSAMMTGGTLYSSAPPSITNPQVNSTISAPNINSPQNTPSSASNSPQKQYKTIPQPQSQGAPSSSSAPAASPTVSSGNTNNTPTLKRKQTEVTSPTTSNSEQPPTKRSQRKRRPAGG